MLDFNSLNYYQRVTYIFKWLIGILGFIGVISNLLAICVFSRKSLRKYSYSFFCVIMAISDVFLLLHLFRHWASYLLQADLSSTSQFFCTMDTFTENISATFSLWMLTVISFDRLFTVVYPNRFQIFKKRWFQVLIVVVLLVYNIAINLPLAIGYQIVNYYIRPYLSIQKCFISLSLNISQSVILAVNFIFTIILVNNVVNVKIVWFLVSSRQKISESLGMAKVRKISSRDRQFAIFSIGLNLNCMFFKLPLILSLLIGGTLKMDLYQTQLFYTAVGFFYSLDNAASLFINLFVNSVFYEEMLIMLRIKKVATFKMDSSTKPKLMISDIRI
jgi:hypothetical protein